MIYDHNGPQRLHALRGYARKADRLDGRQRVNWWLVALAAAFLYSLAVALDMPAIMAAILAAA